MNWRYGARLKAVVTPVAVVAYAGESGSARPPPRLSPQGPMRWEIGAAMDRAAPAAPVTAGACACGNRRATCSRSIWFCATTWSAGLQPACCNTGRCLWLRAQQALRGSVLLQHASALAETGEQHARGPFGFAPPNGTRVCNPPLATRAGACGKGAAGAARSSA
jgi:hypothetical protein